MSTPTQPGWYDDPFRRHEHRYWDGVQWTHHVGALGQREIDPPTPSIDPLTESAGSGAWLPDPFGRHEHRYWDGRQWTHHVGSGGRQLIDPPGVGWVSAPIVPARPTAEAAPPGPASAPLPSKKIQKQVRRAGATGESGAGTLFTEQVLVVNQRAKVFGSTLEYVVYDQTGQRLGAIQEVARSLGARVSDRRHHRDESQRARRFQVIDVDGQVVLAMTRPQSWFGLKSRMVVEGSDGRPIGEITRETLGAAGAAATAGLGGAALVAFTGLGGVAGALVGSALGEKALGLKSGHTRFGLEASGQRLGSIHAEAMNAWDFSIKDTSGTEVGRITKTWAGYAKERFTKADNYVMVMHRPLEDPLRSLVIAAALALDVALKQGSPSHGGGLNKRHYR